MLERFNTLILLLQSLTILGLSYLLWSAEAASASLLLLGLAGLIALAGIAAAAKSSVSASEGAVQGSGQRRQGLVKWFNPSKGFGFIEQDSGDDLFVHQSEIQQAGFRYLNKGDRVEFEIGTGKKGPVALHVIRLEAAPDPYLEERPESISRAS